MSDTESLSVKKDNIKKKNPQPSREHEDEEIVAYLDFLKEFNEESDRAAVILAAAKLDELLYQMLKATLAPCPSGRDDLLDSDRAVGTFSARILLAHRLYLIDDSLAQALSLVRRIRNAFAHQTADARLNGGPQGDRVRELIRPMVGYEEFEEIRLATDAGKHQGLSSGFRSAVAIIGLRLMGAISDSKQVDQQAYTLIPPVWKGSEEDDN